MDNADASPGAPGTVIPVLAVDLSPAHQELLASLLESDQEFTVASAGDEARQATQSRPFAVIVIALQSPDFTGLEIARLMRDDRAASRTPILFVADEPLPAEIVNAGARLGRVDFLDLTAPLALVRARVQTLVSLARDAMTTREAATATASPGGNESALVGLDGDGRIATWNDGATRLFGTPAEEARGRPAATLFLEDAQDGIAALLQHAVEHGYSETDTWCRRSGQSPFRASVVVTTVTDDHGRLRGFTLVTRDLMSRPQADQALLQSEDRFGLLVDQVRDYAIFLLDPQGRVVTWNSGAERIKGYTAEDILGRHFSTFYPAEAIDRGWPDYELRVAGEVGRFEDEGWRVRKDGSMFWANVVITALRDEQGAVRGFLKITRDLTHRKQIEESLRHSEERFRLLVDQARDYAIFVLDTQGLVVTWNTGAQRIKGYTADEILGRHFSCFYPKEAIERGWPDYELRMATEVGRFEDEGWRVRKDGSMFWANVVITTLRNSDGTLRGFSKITRDLTERRAAEETARRLAAEQAARTAAEAAQALIHAREQQLRLFVEHAPAAVAMFDREMRFLLASRRWVAEYRLEGTPLAGRPFRDVLPEAPADWDDIHRRCLAGATERRDEDRLVHPSGAVNWIRWEALPWINAEGEIGGILVFSEDFTERKRAEEELRQQREWRSVTLASIGDAVIATDSAGNVTYLNGIAEQLTGWTSGDAAGQPLDKVFVILNEMTRDVVENPVMKVLREGIIVGLGNHTILIARDGTERPIDDSAAPIRDSQGEIIGVVLIFRDVTDSRRAEHVLRESEARKSAVVAAAMDCIITCDHLGTVLEFNPAAERTFGYRRDEILGKELGELIVPPDYRERFRQGLARYLETGEGPILGKRLELPARRADGTEFPAEMTVSLMPHTGTPLFTAYLREISDIKRTERQRNARLAVTQALTDAQGIEEGVAAVLQGVCENLDWAIGSLWILEDHIELVCRHTWNRIGDAAAEFVESSQNQTFLRGQGLPGRVWDSHQTIWIGELADATDFTRQTFALRAGLHSAVAWPIHIDEQFLGVLEFLMHRKEAFDPSLVEILGTVAGSVGQFLKRKRTEAGLRDQTETAETLNRINNLLTQQLDLQKLLQVVTDESTRLSGAQFGAFIPNTLNQHGDDEGLAVVSGFGAGIRDPLTVARIEELFTPGFRAGGVLRLHDLHEDSHLSPACFQWSLPEGHPPLASYLAVPVIARSGDVLGGLFFGHSTPGVFTSQHERLLAGVASQAAVAIDNARLYQSAQSTADRLNLAMTAASLGDWSWDATRDLVTLSDRTAEIFGIPAGQLLTWNAFLALLHEPDRDRVRDEIERAIAERSPYDVQYRVLRPDGESIWMQALGRALYDSQDRVIGIHGVVHDISDRKQLEESLRTSEERFRGLMEQAPFGIQVFDPEGRTIRVNHAWETLWGIPFATLAGRSIFDDPQFEAQGVIPQLRRAFAGEPAFIPPILYDPRQNLADVPSPLAAERWVSAVAYPLKDAADHVVEVVLVYEDITDRRRAQTALRESEEKLRLMADTIPQLAWMTRPDGSVFWYNRRWFEYTGTTFDEVEGWRWQSLIHPDALPPALERWKHSLTTGEPFDMVFPIRGVDGRYRPFLTRVNALRNDSGEILYWFGTNTDVAELRQAREALASSEERLRLALNAGRMGVWDWNIRTGSLKWSESLELVYGLEPGTFGGTLNDFERLIHPDDRNEVVIALRQAIENEDDVELEFRNVRDDGRVRWIAATGRVFPGSDDSPLRMIGVGLDITQRKRAEQTSRFLADASAALALIVDFDSSLQRLAGLAVPHFADWAIVDVVEDRELRRVAIKNTDSDEVRRAQDLGFDFPLHPRAAGGTWDVIESGRAYLSPVLDLPPDAESATPSIAQQFALRSGISVPLMSRGKTIGALTFLIARSTHRYDETDLAVAQDLANRAAIAIENAQLYRELREADVRKDEFLATLAHELRNPLAPIRNGLQVLRLSGSSTETARETRAMMERQLNQMVRLVDDLLDVSRITRNKLELRKDRVLLGAVIQSAIETSRPLIEQFRHRLTVNLSPLPVALDADPVRLAQVFSNLLNNSAKYTEPGGKIELDATVKDGVATVRVRDNGLGIPAEAMPRLFQMFSQVDRNMQRAEGGLGIGLTLVRRLVEMHGGTVEAHSDGPGRGSVFTVTIPVVRDSATSLHSTQLPVATSSTRRRILVVDDNHDSAQSLSMMLSLMGNETQIASDGLAAVAAAASFQPDLIFLDIGLPKLNGYEACRRIREVPLPRRPVIVALTGWGQDEDRRRSQEAGFDHHLVKPVDIADLNSILEQHA